ncbi:hypothetical protein JCM11251_005390 [Rhodosporidiobolus azoricus]
MTSVIKLGHIDIPLWSGKRTRTFLSDLERNFSLAGVKEADHVTRINYFFCRIKAEDDKKIVRDWDEFQTPDSWEKFKEKLFEEFDDDEENAYKKTLIDFANGAQSRGGPTNRDAFKVYDRHFKHIVKCMTAGELSEDEKAHQYLKGLGTDLKNLYLQERMARREAKRATAGGDETTAVTIATIRKVVLKYFETVEEEGAPHGEIVHAEEMEYCVPQGGWRRSRRRGGERRRSDQEPEEGGNKEGEGSKAGHRRSSEDTGRFHSPRLDIMKSSQSR